MSATRDMTSGRPLKQILLFCVPLFIGNIFQQIYNMADSIIVGHFIGVNAFAAVGATGCITFCILGLAQGSCAGFAIPIAQEFGAKDMVKMRRAVAASAQVTAVVGVPLTVITLICTGPLLRLLNTPADIYEDSYRYLFTIFTGIVPCMLYNLLASVLRAVGDSRTPLYFLAIASVANVVMDLLFVGTCSMGVQGAALATVLAQLLSGVLCLWYIARKVPLLHPTKEEWAVDMPTCRREVAVGLPMGLQISITAIGSIILQAAVNGLGSMVVASISASSKVSMLLYAPMDAIGIAMATYCGQNYGARRMDRVQKGTRRSTLVMCGYSILCHVICIYWSPTIALLFIDSSETAVLENLHHFLSVNSCFYIPLILIYVYRNALQGMGYSKPAMLAGLFELVARSCVGLLLVGRFGFDAVCYANPAAWVAADILLLPLYFGVMHYAKRTQTGVSDPADSAQNETLVGQ